MQFLTQYLRSSRLASEPSLTEGDVSITVKLDGTALQCEKKKGELVFYKRSNSPEQPGTPMVDFDIILRLDYANAVHHLMGYEEDIPEGLLLNFEIFSDKDKHIISYSDMDNDIVLLSAYKDGESVSRQDLEDMASALEIGVVDEVFRGNISPADYKEMRRYANSDDSAGLFDWMCEKYGFENGDEIEGFVMTFTDNKDKLRELKVNNPDFQSKLYAHLDEEEMAKGRDYSEVIGKFIKKAEKYIPEVGGDTKEDRLLTLISLMMPDGFGEFCTKIGKDVMDLFDEDSGATINDFIHPTVLDDLNWEVTNDYELKGLKFLMMVCQNIRKNPLWTSEEGLEELNDFLTKLYGDVA